MQNGSAQQSDVQHNCTHYINIQLYKTQHKSIKAIVAVVSVSIMTLSITTHSIKARSITETCFSMRYNMLNVKLLSFVVTNIRLTC
jgi:hypothetical protein